jgi:cytochrome c556
MLRIASIVAVLGVGATVVYAQSAAIGQRQQAMKGLGSATTTMNAMAKGEAPFELPKVQASLKVIEDQVAKLKELFPEDSRIGETRALPKVWENKADFMARLDKLAADAKAAEAAIKDEASLKAEWSKVVANCGGCHKEYRRPEK